MQAPQRWILNDLVLAGAELDTRRLDHFDAYNYDIPDKEKHSEVLSKSAGLGAVCAVLILNISFAAPFNISKLYLDPSTSNIQVGFSTFIIADAFAFAFSMAATFWLSFAGLSIVDMRTRVIYLNKGSICLSSAVYSMVIVFLLGICAVVGHVDAIITIAACVIALGGLIPLLGFTIYRHFWVLYHRLGFRTWCRTFLGIPPQQRHLQKYGQLGKNSLFVIIITLGLIITNMSITVTGKCVILRLKTVELSLLT
nr:uncharacterized protein LOC127303220 [Lolium perenne]